MHVKSVVRSLRAHHVRLARLEVLCVEELGENEVHRAADVRHGGDRGVLQGRPRMRRDGGHEGDVRVLAPEKAAPLEERVVYRRETGYQRQPQREVWGRVLRVPRG